MAACIELALKKWLRALYFDLQAGRQEDKQKQKETEREIDRQRERERLAMVWDFEISSQPPVTHFLLKAPPSNPPQTCPLPGD